jgi:hypothetical protein
MAHRILVNKKILLKFLKNDSIDFLCFLACIFPFALALVDYNFCIPLEPNFVCSRSRVIDRNSTYNSLDCSRNSS